MLARYAKVTLGFALLFTVFFSPAIFGGNLLTVAGDGSNIALPAYEVPHGLWEPDIMLGYPWASNFSGYWDPLFWLHWIPHSFNAYMLAAYVIAAVGAFGCVDSLTRSAVGGAVAGTAYALGGFMIGHLGHYDVVHPAAWVPFVFWALIAQLRSTRILPVVLGAVAVALCALAGQPQVLVYMLLFAAAFIVVHAIGAHEHRWMDLLRGIATMVLGLGLGSIALAPGLVLTLASFRVHVSLDYFLAYSVPVAQLLPRLLLPYVAGSSALPFYPYSTIDHGPDAEYSGYVGLVTLVLAALAIIVRRNERTVMFFALSALAGLVLSAGDGFHIAALTYHVPFLNLFRAQGRHMLEFTLFAAILGGIGAAELAAGRVSAKRLMVATGTLALLLVGAICIAFGSGLLAGPAVSVMNPALAVPVALFVAIGLALAYYRARPASILASALLALVVLADLTSFAWFEYWRAPLTRADITMPAELGPLRSQLEAVHQRMFSVAGGTTLDGVPPNLSLIWGIPSAGGYVQLLLTSPGILLQLSPQGTIAPAVLLDPADRSLDLAAIRYVAVPVDQAVAFATARPTWRRVLAIARGVFFENPNAMPRVKIMHRVQVMPVDRVLDAIRSGSVDTRDVAMVQEGDPLTSAFDPSDAATITALSADAMRVNARCRAACYLQTSDTYNGMWTVLVDGIPAKLHLTDYALRGVAIAPGTHVVDFIYRPWIVWAGAALTCAIAVLMAALLVVPRFLRRAG